MEKRLCSREHENRKSSKNKKNTAMKEDGAEQKLSEFITGTKYEGLTPEAIITVKNIVLTILGTTIAGSRVSGIVPLVEKIKDWGGKEEASILVHGGKVPAHHAAFINSVMARALDFDDAFAPGPHFGAATVPAALAASELMEGCSGKEFITALALGSELSARLNLTEEQYNGFDPTGVCSVFAAAAAAGKLLGLTAPQMRHNLALAFNRCSGSFQSHIDGSLAVRLNQGFVAQNGILSAELALMDMTGPKDFLNGIYGFYHLYGKDRYNSQAILADLGKQFRMTDTVFKRYPSCGATQSSTEAILALTREHDLKPENVTAIEVYVTPYAYKLTGKEFLPGNNPRVDAQFSIQYCVANALLRKSSRLEHFDDEAVKDPRIVEIIRKIHVFEDSGLDASGHTAMRMTVKTASGQMCNKNIDVASGFPGHPLTPADHRERFQLCLAYTGDFYPLKNAEKIVSLVERLEKIEDIRVLLPLLSIP
jgi:2-methylcitrate dehydratase PrpD